MSPIPRPSLSPNAAQTDPSAMPGVPLTHRTLLSTVLGPAGRTPRIVAFLTAIAILSLADLYMTLTHLLSFGLLEQNPLARFIITHGSPAALVAWKCITVGFAITVMYRLRRRPSAEIGALFCVAVLTWLTFRWSSYNDQVSRLTEELQNPAASAEPAWVTMTTGD